MSDLFTVVEYIILERSEKNPWTLLQLGGETNSLSANGAADTDAVGMSPAS